MDIIRRRTTLNRQITKFREVQALYIPSAAQIVANKLAADASGTSRLAESTPLVFPSSLPPKNLASCAEGIVCAEERLREGQCNDALNSMRMKLFIKSRLVTYKKDNGANTRAQALLKTNQAKINRAACKYRNAYSALLSLRGPGTWQTTLCELKDDDIRPLAEDDKDTARKKKKWKGPAEGRRLLSWIWYSGNNSDSASIADELDSAKDDAVRIEWLKARARKKWWAEELQLLEEEHRGIGVFLQYKATWWEGLAKQRPDASEPLQEGLAAYAKRQAFIQRGLANKFDKLWEDRHKAPRERAPCEDLGDDGGGDQSDDEAPVVDDDEEEELF
ncbi:hypothetical protein EIP91_011195 [Steccherinum ochraceum]|uniref:Uncharacterized protein n=1 Tax=Steccherinum ochraceum TaxID=92696 RepID=A0A4R0QZY2_9APHY|nr:hypothetical protein EIP91_011195 [Steccherinum ochraceum]